ncbi:MAG: ribonuclease HII [Acidobacteria bacterium]|nr:ribonuclease HII [Acidobacteriota bacterium]
MSHRTNGNRSNCCTAELERRLRAAGYRSIAGVDEVGRGALAGPVVAAAVVLNLDQIPEGIDDSKKLTPARRGSLAQEIRRTAVALSLALVESHQVDRLNVGRATRLAMRQAVEGLELKPNYLLIDALRLHGVAIPQEGIIHGDALSVSIAAASIIAKVARDEMMRQYDEIYPGYGFARHVGYGTLEHRQALIRLGPCAIHRLSFHGVIPDLFPDDLSAM